MRNQNRSFSGGGSEDVATQAELDAKVSDTAYDATSWNGVTTVAPSKNAVRDKIEDILDGVTQYSQPTDGTTRASSTFGSLGTAWTDTVTTTAALPRVAYRIQVSFQLSADAIGYIGLTRGGTLIERRLVYTAGAGTRENVGILLGVDNPGAANTYTYEVVVSTNGGETMTVNSSTDTSTAASLTADGNSHMLLNAVGVA